MLYVAKYFEEDYKILLNPTAQITTDSSYLYNGCIIILLKLSI